MKVLVSDNLSATGVDILKKESGLEVDVKYSSDLYALFGGFGLQMVEKTRRAFRYGKIE